eukprot:7190120-Pyramimonas_sp.AAC.1
MTNSLTIAGSPGTQPSPMYHTFASGAPSNWKCAQSSLSIISGTSCSASTLIAALFSLALLFAASWNLRPC